MKFSLASFVLMTWHLTRYSAVAQYVEPEWWPLIVSTFTGVNLRRCYKRDGTIKPLGAPADGSSCAKNPKTCFFGTQDCAGVAYPETKCSCNDRVWQCDAEACPSTPSAAPSMTCEKPSALTELDSMPPVSCIPTSGSCIGNFLELEAAAASAGSGHVLTLCSGATITATSVVTLTPSDLTLCCEGTSNNCVVEGAIGSVPHRILDVKGANFVLSGIKVRGACRLDTYSLDGGGNRHTIVDCQFEDGPNEGNLDVYTSGQVALLRSRFLNSQTSSESFTGANIYGYTMLVQDCEFVGPFGLAGNDVEICASKFIGSSTDLTGLIVVATQITSLPKLDVILSEFEDSTSGGWLLGGPADGNLRLCGNQESDSVADSSGRTCDGFPGFNLAVDYPPNDFCVAIDEDYPA